MPVTIEPFSPKYGRAVADLIVSIQREEFGISISYDDQPDLNDISGYYQKGAGEFWLALEGERVVGTVALLDIGGGEGALRKMFVAADRRGRSEGGGAGVAQRLLETLVGHARRRALAAIYLGTTEAFVTAHRFYERHGFARLDANRLPAAFPRMSVDTRFYLLDLAGRGA